MATTTSLTELSATHHDERVARLIALGKQAAAGDGKARAEIDALHRSADAFARAMAVWTAFGSKDGALILRSLHDASAHVRRLAFRLVAVVCDDAQAFDALQVAYGTRRDKAFLLALHACDRIAAVDRGIDWIAERPGIHDFADIVPLGSKYSVKKHLGRALERPSEIFWERLARNHADVLGGILRDRIEAAGDGESDPITRQLVQKHHSTIAERAPAQALAIAELLAKRQIDSDAHIWSPLSKTHLGDVLDFADRWLKGKLPVAITVSEERVRTLPLDVLAKAARMALNLRGRVEDLPEDRRRAIADGWAAVAKDHATYGTKLLRWVTDRELRASAFEYWRAGSMNPETGAILVDSLNALPLDLREQEGRRHIHDVVALKTRPFERIPYAQFLPFDEAKRAIAEYLGHPEGGMRGYAISTLLRVMQQRPDEADVADQLLEMVLARKNEQDPVRQNMFMGLCAWKRETWKLKHTRAITQMLRDALDASDLSSGTAAYGETLILRCFHLDPAWAARELGVWLKERGQLNNANLGAHLEEEDVKAAASVLLGIADAWTTQERFAMVIALAASLADRMKLIPGFFDVIERARDRCPWGGWALQLAKLVREHAPERYEAAVPALVRTWLDKGWYGEITGLANDYDPGDTVHEDIAMALERIITTSGTQWQVIAAVDALRSRANRRFGKRIERILDQDPSLVALPIVAQYIHRRRQDLITRYLEGRVPVTGRFATGLTRWVLPYTKGFWRWTSAQSTLFAGQHVRVVANTERDTPTILRSMVTLPEMCWAPMDGLIAFANDERPVVKEKAIRVIARCDQAQGIPMLLACLEDERARIAIYGLRKALKDLPPARAFAILVGAPLRRVTVAKEVLRLLGELRSEDAYRHLLKLDAGPDLHRDVRIALLRALWDHLEREETWSIFERAVTAPDWIMASRLGDIPADRLTKTSDARLSKLLTKVVTRDEPEARLDLLRRAPHLGVRDPERTFLSACRDRISSPYDDEVRAAVWATLYRSDESDIPALRATLAKVHGEDDRAAWVAMQTILSSGASRRVFVMAAEAVDDLAKTDAALTPTRLRAAKTLAVTAEAIAKLLDDVAATGRMSSDAMLEARTLIDTIDIKLVEGVEKALRRSVYDEVRRLAIHALARDAGKDRGWTDERLRSLAEYQRDPAVVVRAAATAVFPPREIAPRRGSLGD